MVPTVNSGGWGYYKILFIRFANYYLGHYVYIKASSPRKPGDKALMISQLYKKTPGECFTFWYYMFGNNIGSLTLFQRFSGHDSILWSRNRREGDVWRRALVTVKSLAGSYQVYIIF